MNQIKQTETKVADPLLIRKGIQKYIREFPERFVGGEFPPQKHLETDEEYQKRRKRTRGAMNGNFTKILKKYVKRYADERAIDLSPSIDLYRYLIFSWVITPDDEVLQKRSTSEYEDSAWFAISRWQGSHQDQNGQWVLRDTFEEEVLQVLHCAKEDWKSVELGEKYPMYFMVDRWGEILQDKNHFGQEEFEGYVQSRFDDIQETNKGSGLFIPEPPEPLKPLQPNEPLVKGSERCKVVFCESKEDVCDECHQIYNSETSVVCPFCFS